MAYAYEQFKNDNDLNQINFNKLKRRVQILEELGAGRITVLDEGIEIQGTARKLNFIGTDVSAARFDPDQINIYIPAVELSPLFNQSNAIGNANVFGPSTTSKFLSNPEPENNFFVGNLPLGTQHPALITQTIAFSHTDPCLFYTNTTNVVAQIFRQDGTLLASLDTGPIAASNVFSNTNIQVSILSFTSLGAYYTANISVNFYLNNIIPNGGAFYTVITHFNDTQTPFYQSPVIFYDPNNVVSTINNVAIAETTAVIKKLSGISHYDIGSTFTVDVNDIDHLNNLTYPSTVLYITASELGLPALALGASSLTNWTNYWNNQNASYQKTNWMINQTNYYYKGISANASARTQDWINNPFVDSNDLALLIETHSILSTRINEYFYDESWRCPITGDFDLSNQRTWDSNLFVGNDDAVFHNGSCGRFAEDFTLYNPNDTLQPNYTTLSPSVWLYREVQHNGTSSSGARIYISGSYATLEMKLAKAYDGTSSGGTVWINCLQDYNASDWNNGNPSSSGCRVASASNYIDITFGTNNISLTSNTVYFRVSFTGTQSINTFQIVFS